LTFTSEWGIGSCFVFKLDLFSSDNPLEGLILENGVEDKKQEVPALISTN
jgi:hypothetical protein